MPNTVTSTPVLFLPELFSRVVVDAITLNPYGKIKLRLFGLPR